MSIQVEDNEIRQRLIGIFTKAATRLHTEDPAEVLRHLKIEAAEVEERVEGCPPGGPRRISEPEDDIAGITDVDRLRTLVRIYRLLAQKRAEHIGELEVQVERLRAKR